MSISFLKRLIPNNVKQQGKYFLYDLLRIPYTRSGLPPDIAQWLPADKAITFIDIGASVGNFSEMLVNHYEISKGILVEPLTKWIPLLESRYSDRQVFGILNCAVSDHEGDVTFYVSEEFDSISSLLKINKDAGELADLNIKGPVPVTIRATTLDDIYIGQNLSAIDLLKIDVQGAEHLVLNGGSNTLKNTRLVFTEFSFKPIYKGSSTFFDLYNILYQNNFRLVSISKGYEGARGELLQGDALFVSNSF